MPADGLGNADDKDFGDILREQTALIAGLADRYGDYVRRWSAVVNQLRVIPTSTGVQPPTTPPSNMSATEQHARLLSQATAALALAHDDMMVNGGPENSEATPDMCRPECCIKRCWFRTCPTSLPRPYPERVNFADGRSDRSAVRHLCHVAVGLRLLFPFGRPRRVCGGVER